MAGEQVCTGVCKYCMVEALDAESGEELIRIWGDALNLIVGIDNTPPLGG